MTIHVRTAPALAADVIAKFKKACAQESYESTHILPHGSYLVNLAVWLWTKEQTKEDDKWNQAYTFFIDDLKRCEALGIKYYNIHPGSAVGGDKKAALKVNLMVNFKESI